MSHIVTIRTEVRDAGAVRQACKRLSWPQPNPGTHRLYAQDAEGLAVQPPKWRYPIVCELSSGKLHYDNFGGRWGETAELNRFKQAYAVERTILETRREGHTVVEEPLANGSIRLTVQLHS